MDNSHLQGRMEVIGVKNFNSYLWHFSSLENSKTNTAIFQGLANMKSSRAFLYYFSTFIYAKVFQYVNHFTAIKVIR